MEEVFFRRFGEALDSLYTVKYGSDEDFRNQLEPVLYELDKIYKTVKETYGYKDNSDKE